MSKSILLMPSNLMYCDVRASGGDLTLSARTLEQARRVTLAIKA